MPTYEYKCERCGLRFERQQSILEATLIECPECRGEVHRIVSGGVGIILKSSGQGRIGHSAGACSLEQGGKTCCGLNERCGKPPCGDKE